MPFISPDELNTHIYAQAATAIADGDETILPAAIAAAEQEACGYMSKFDFATLLAATDNARDPILMLYIKDMALWHFLTLGNANFNYEVAKDRYKLAITWFDKIKSGRIVPAGWPIATTPEIGNFFHLTSNTKRSNNY